MDIIITHITTNNTIRVSARGQQVPASHFRPYCYPWSDFIILRYVRLHCFKLQSYSLQIHMYLSSVQHRYKWMREYNECYLLGRSVISLSSHAPLDGIVDEGLPDRYHPTERSVN